MYQLTVEREFCAAHAIRIKGHLEPRHGHNWRLVVVVSGDQLDDDGLLCDFHRIERALDRVLEPFDNADLNETPPFDRVNPTAENVVRHLADAVAAELPSGVRLGRVTVSEAPGCAAAWVARGDH